MSDDAERLGLGHELDVRVAAARGAMSANDERILAFVRAHLDELAFHTAEFSVLAPDGRVLARTGHGTDPQVVQP